MLVAGSAMLDWLLRARSAARPWHFDVERGQQAAAEAARRGDLAGFGVRGPDARDRRRRRAARLRRQDAGPGAARTSRAVTVGARRRISCASTRPRAATSRSPRRCAASPRRRSSRCSTNAPRGMGSRLLRHWLHHPLRDRKALRRAPRGARAASANRRRCCTRSLRGFSDVERITARVALRSARPRELAGLRDSLALLPALRTRAAARAVGAAGCSWRARPGDARRMPGAAAASRCTTSRPRACSDGGVIADGYERRARRAARPADERGRVPGRPGDNANASAPASPNLRVAYNSVHGFYIEVTNRRPTRCPTTTGAGRR